MREEPLFNLKAVVKQTGLRPDTLRAWERRYGLPSPARSDGRHRLYSQRDVDIIRWLLARQGEGLSISRAVEMWHQLEAEGLDPMQAATTAAVSPPPAVSVVLGSTMAQLRTAWIGACLAYDERQSEQALTQAFSLYPPEAVCLELLQPALAELGERWARGEVTVQQEHFTSALAIRRLESLILAAPAPMRTGRILVSCPPEESHVFSLQVLTLLLRRQGWSVVYLGADVPTDRLETTVDATRPQLVILAAQRLRTAATLSLAAQVIRQTGVPLAYGGLIFSLMPALQHRIPGHFLGEHLGSAPAVVEALMTFPRPHPPVEPVPEAYRRAGEHFHNRLGLVESDLLRQAGALSIDPLHLDLANREMALNIAAALDLGDMDYLGSTIEWAGDLLHGHHVPAGTLDAYLCAYGRAVAHHLDQRGEPVVAWLDHWVGPYNCRKEEEG